MNNCKVLKRVFSAAIFMAASLVQLTGCDSREDWFAKEGEEATFIIKSYKWPMKWEKRKDPSYRYEFRTDTFRTDKKGVIEYNLNLDFYNYHKDRGLLSYSDVLHLEVAGVTDKTEIPYTFELGEYSIVNLISEPELIEDQNDYHFVGVAAGSNLFDSDTSAALSSSADLYAGIRDVFNNPYICHIIINFWGDVPPIPVVEIKDVAGFPMEKTISLKNSYDKDGDIVMYEYCIDGNVVAYKHATVDIHPQCPAPSGKGAYGGTYITATEESEIKHAFQTEGEHEVYCRCKDDKEVWSSWKKETVTVKLN